MKKNSIQIRLWQSAFGQSFTKRWDIPVSTINAKAKKILGSTVTDLLTPYIKGSSINTILEVGCNSGRKMELISKLGKFQMYGLDPQLFALKKARRRLTTFNFIQGTANDIPFKENFFDLVYTYEVLIHISPQNLERAIREIVRVSNKYILHMEYYSPGLEEVTYRGHTNSLWKTDFEAVYKTLFPTITTVKSQLIEWKSDAYDKSGLFSKLFLLKK